MLLCPVSLQRNAPQTEYLPISYASARLLFLPAPLPLDIGNAIIARFLSTRATAVQNPYPYPCLPCLPCLPCPRQKNPKKSGRAECHSYIIPFMIGTTFLAATVPYLNHNLTYANPRPCVTIDLHGPFLLSPSSPDTKSHRYDLNGLGASSYEYENKNKKQRASDLGRPVPLA